MKNAMKSLNSRSSSGYDNIPSVLFTECADVLCTPLTIIFNLCLSTGDYPDLLKFNNIVPIFKQGGERKNIESYRGISIQPVISKLFVRVLKEFLQPHLPRLIVDEQHGFQPNKSTFTNLAVYSDFLSDALENKYEVHSIYTDFRKAFDVVPHNLLLLKMKCYF